MLRVKVISSVFLHSGGFGSPSHLRSSVRQFHLLPSVGRQFSSKLLPAQIHHTHVKGFCTIGGIAAATAFAGSLVACRRIVLAQEAPKGDDSPAKDHHTEWNEDPSSLAVWMKRLWVPFLMVMTIAMGWQYPVSLGINILFLLWSTKPTPSSIYIWVEQKRLLAASRVHGLSRIKAQLSNASMMMHVDVRDYGLACLARVSSLSQSMLVIGVLGDWWVLYSRSSSISGFNLGSWFPMSPMHQW